MLYSTRRPGVPGNNLSLKYSCKNCVLLKVKSMKNVAQPTFTHLGRSAAICGLGVPFAVVIGALTSVTDQHRRESLCVRGMS
jgi:hypothetical protein